MSDFTIAELERRLLNIIRFGTIASVDLDAATCRVKLTDDHTTGDLPWQTQRAGTVRTWSPPSVGEQVTLLSPAGDLSQAIVLLALFQNDHSAPSNSANKHVTDYGDGTVTTYNTASHKLTINCAGDVEVITAGNVHLGGLDGPAVARIGDKVAVGSGSSSGQWPIITGSSKVSAT